MRSTVACFMIVVLVGPAGRAQDGTAGPPAEPPPGAEERPATMTLDDALGEVSKSVAGIARLALIRPEGTGTSDDLSGLEKSLFDRLSVVEGLAVISAEEVFTRVGPEFAISPEGIAGVAKKMDAAAALFVRVFGSPDRVDLHVLLVAADAKVLLDRSFPLAALPPGVAPAPEPEISAPTPRPDEAAPEATLEQPEPPAPDPEAEAREAFEQRAVALAPRQRVVGGASIGVGGRHISVGIHSPVMVTGDWMVLEGGTPVSELHLAKLAGFEDIAKRIQDDIGSLKTLRNVGIGMTIGGFLTAGVAFPFFKSEGEDETTAAGVVVGTGLVVGAIGVTLWLMYGADAAGANTPYPQHHLITRKEAERMIDACNGSLRRELDLQAPPPPPETGPEVGFTVVPDPRGGAAAALTIRF